MIDEPHQIISAAIAAHKPSNIFVLFSGGHDSLSCTHVAMRHPQVREMGQVVHVNTGIGVEQTRHFVRATCAEHGWPLLELHPPVLTYEEMVLKYGFPGPGAHTYPYVWLKQRALDKLVRERRTGRQTTMFVTGVRKQESERRMGHVEPIFKQPGRRIVWVAPLIDWTARQCGDYIEQRGMKRNEVVDLLHMSGECLCGAFAKPGELEWLSHWYPEVVERIRALECRAKEARVHCQWGVRPPSFHKELREGQQWLPLCHSCWRWDTGEVEGAA